MIKNVALLILVDKNKLLLQHRTDDAPRFPGFWGFFGGQIDEGKTPDKAIIREIIEELDYHLDFPKKFLEIDFAEPDIKGSRYYFIEQYKGQELTLGEG